MCLNNAKKITVPEEGIKCYKVAKVVRVEKPDDYGQTVMLESPYQRFKYRVGNTYTIQEQREVEIEDDPWVDGVKRVYGNAYHACANYEGVFRVLDNVQVQLFSDKEMAVLECTIPADSRYAYEGMFSNKKGYASSNLRIDRVVPTEELDAELQKCGLTRGGFWLIHFPKIETIKSNEKPEQD